MTAAILFCLLLLPTGSIGWDIWSDEMADRTARDLARLSVGSLPAARSLNPDDWPKPLSPLDLPSIGDTSALAAAQLAPRVVVAAPVPVVAELRVGGGRHRLGAVPGTERQQASWDTPTGQFWLIVDGIGDLTEPCSHCAAPEDGEPAHVGCPGCACPCGLAVAA